MSFFNHLLNEYKDSYSYLFSDKDFYKKLWLLPLLLFIPFLKYPFGIIFIKGWQVQMVEDLMKGKPLQRLNISNVFLKGMLITSVTLLYLVVPTLLCYLLGLKGVFAFISDILEFITNGFKGYLIDYIEDYFFTIAIYFIWGIISNPLIQCGIIKYSVSNNWTDLINLPKNLIFLITHAHQFIKFYIFYLVTLAILVIIDIFLLVIFFPIELILIPFLTVLYYGAVSHELGHLARKIYLKNNTDILSIENTNVTKNLESKSSPIFFLPNNEDNLMTLSEKSLFTYFIECFSKNYLNFNGRARKKEYWGFMLFYLIIDFMLHLISLTGIGAIFALIVIIVVAPPSLTVTVRRLHDINKSGWFALFILLALIPVIGIIIALIITVILGLIDGTKGKNQYGEDPLIMTSNEEV